MFINDLKIFFLVISNHEICGHKNNIIMSDCQVETSNEFTTSVSFQMSVFHNTICKNKIKITTEDTSFILVSWNVVALILYDPNTDIQIRTEGGSIIL